jgi:hypothetical protein
MNKCVCLCQTLSCRRLRECKCITSCFKSQCCCVVKSIVFCMVGVCVCVYVCVCVCLCVSLSNAFPPIVSQEPTHHVAHSKRPQLMMLCTKNDCFFYCELCVCTCVCVCVYVRLCMYVCVSLSVAAVCLCVYVCGDTVKCTC